MIKGKKAQWIALISIVFLIVAVITFFYIRFGQEQEKGQQRYVGENQIALMKTAQKAEKILIHIDQSAKYAVSQSIIELADNGGYFDEPECGSYYGYNLWIKEEKCFPKEIPKDFGFYINKNLLPYLAVNSLIPLNNYNIKIQGFKIFGKAIKNIELDIEKQLKKDFIDSIREGEPEPFEVPFGEMIKFMYEGKEFISPIDGMKLPSKQEIEAAIGAYDGSSSKSIDNYYKEFFTDSANLDSTKETWDQSIYTICIRQPPGGDGWYLARGGKHAALDLKAVVGTPVRAIADGEIVYVRPDNDPAGRRVSTRHGSITTKNFHLSPYGYINGEKVNFGKYYDISDNKIKSLAAGERIGKGDIIGFVGVSGNALNVPCSHLHFEFYTNGRRVDPMQTIYGGEPAIV